MDEDVAVNQKPIEHGGNLRGFAERYQISENQILDFSSNINPLGIPDSVRRLYLESAAELSRYPDPTCTELCDEITKHFSIRSKNVIAGNGSMSLLGLAIRALAPRRALIIEPCFAEYRRLLEQQGTQIRSLLLKEENNFNFELAPIIEALPGMDLLVLTHPNNPTGTALRRDEMLELLYQARRHQVTVIVDEAFADWSPEISVTSQIREYSNFMVVKSLTKFFALAGIRSGFALAPSKYIVEMQKHQETWSVNRLSEKLSVAALRDKDFQTKSRKWFQEESAWLCEALKSLGIFKVYPGLANFFLLRFMDAPTSLLPHKVGEELGGGMMMDLLGKKGIYIRAGLKGLDNAYFRIAVRLREENRLLVESLRECLHLSSPSYSTSQ